MHQGCEAFTGKLIFSYMRRQQLKNKTREMGQTTLLVKDTYMDNLVHLPPQWLYFVTCNDERCRYQYQVFDYKLPIDC